jgi:hypothetical protein
VRGNTHLDFHRKKEKAEKENVSKQHKLKNVHGMYVTTKHNNKNEDWRATKGGKQKTR